MKKKIELSEASETTKALNSKTFEKLRDKINRKIWMINLPSALFWIYWFWIYC